MEDYQLQKYFERYLKEIRKNSDSTVKHYKNALNFISKFLIGRKMIKQTIYEIQDIDELESIREYLLQDTEFVDWDERGHRMYSAGLNNCYRFASGEKFAEIYKGIEILDIKIPCVEKKFVTSSKWTRSNIIKNQSIESARYQCEVDPLHKTFIAKSTSQPYMEGHHAIPMKYQEKFSNSLDVYANVVCLCPICHRMLHYGEDEQRETVVKKIYHDRSDRLVTSGLIISESDFEKFAIR